MTGILLMILFAVAAFAALCYFGIRAIEQSEEEYDRDPDGWEERNPERRELF